uniref:Putative secreted protein n=1 Tax=Ixodes ricinus TaxID=34613 RepID=A0A6B0UE79_IXORI
MQFPIELIIVSLTTLLMSFRSLCRTSVSDQCALQLLHSSMCFAISESAACMRTFLLCSSNLSLRHLEVCPTYLNPHVNGISYTTFSLQGTENSRWAF